MSIQRQAMAAMTSLYFLYPDIEKKISLKQSASLLSAMAICGMFMQPEHGPRHASIKNVQKCVQVGINYETSIRVLAKVIGIKKSIAINFIRGCFRANKLAYLYPYSDPIFGSEYAAVAKYVTPQLAQYVIEYLAGDRYFESRDLTVDEKYKYRSRAKNKLIKYGTFYLLPKFAKINANCETTAVKLFLINAFDYISRHPDRNAKKSSEFASKKIFIDEVINYIREYDEDQFNKFRDKIEEMFLKFDDYSVLPNCIQLKIAFGLEGLSKKIHTFKSGFLELIRPKEWRDGTENEISDDESEVKIAMTPSSAAAQDAIILEPNVVPIAILRPENSNQEYARDIARAIELSLREM